MNVQLTPTQLAAAAGLVGVLIGLIVVLILIGRSRAKARRRRARSEAALHRSVSAPVPSGPSPWPAPVPVPAAGWAAEPTGQALLHQHPRYVDEPTFPDDEQVDQPAVHEAPEPEPPAATRAPDFADSAAGSGEWEAEPDTDRYQLDPAGYPADTSDNGHQEYQPSSDPAERADHTEPAEPADPADHTEAAEQPTGSDPKDRLLRVLLTDPDRAVTAVSELESTQSQLNELTDSLRFHRRQLADVARRLRSAGLTPAQVARLAGVGEGELVSLLAEHAPSPNPRPEPAPVGDGDG